MALSSDLMSQFAKNVVGNEKQKTETNAYGTVVIVGEEIYVRLDGADQDRLIPMETTAEVKDGERVTIRIKNHNATITGNVSSPAARIGSVEEIDGKVAIAIQRIDANEANIDKLNADYAEIGTLYVTKADIESLNSKFITVEQLTAINGRFDKVESEYVSTDVLESTYIKAGDINSLSGEIRNLDAKYVTITDANIERIAANEAVIKNLDTKYANVDFANIGEAAVEKLFSEAGIIGNLVMEDGNVTGHLVGVTISGDLIEGNTIKADKLIVKGEDGLYHKINVDGGVTTSEELTEEELQNGIHGSIIIAKSITADQIYVSDLVAFGASIGGFDLTEDAIHSKAKDSVDSTVEGVYMDSEGQFAIGGTSDHIKYYKTADGKYKLDITAASIKLAAGNSLESALAGIGTSGQNLIVRRDEIKNTLVSPGKDELAQCHPSAQQATMHDYIPVEPGETYTFSNTSKEHSFFQWCYYNENKDWISRHSVYDQVYSITIPENAAYIRVSYIYAEGSQPKLEKGSEATPYSPAPADMPTFEDVVDTVESAIEVSEQGITSYVSGTYTTKTEFNDLEIGACNLIQNSDFSNGTNLWVKTGVEVEVQVDSEYGTCLKMTSSDIGSSTHRIYPSTTENFIHKGGTYSLSFYAKTDSEGGATLQTNVAGGTDIVKNHTLTTSWKRYTFTYEASSGPITFWLNEAEKTAYITRVQMERGDKVTDWKPAPNDIATLVDVNNANSEINSSIESINTRIASSETLIQQLKNEISSLVVDENGASMMTQTENGVQFSMGSVLGSIKDVLDTVDDLKNKDDSLDSDVTSLKNAMTDIGALTEHVEIGTYTYIDENGVEKEEPSLALYEDDSDFRHVITNTQAMYMDGENVSTRIDNEGVETDNVTVKNEIRQDAWVWKTRANGNLGLTWKE